MALIEGRVQLDDASVENIAGGRILKESNAFTNTYFLYSDSDPDKHYGFDGTQAMYKIRIVEKNNPGLSDDALIALLMQKNLIHPI